jgi:Tfp pilus assembly pilus retraction ATPase PilT
MQQRRHYGCHSHGALIMEDTVPLAQLEFTDLLIGPHFCEIRGLKGSDGGFVPAPCHVRIDVEELHKNCRSLARSQNRHEFAVERDSVRYRVTMVSDVDNNDIYILCKIEPAVRSFDDLPFSDRVRTHLLRPNLDGLVLITGAMRAGKTSTASSLFKGRLETNGGFGLTIEDPPELELNGQHGGGRAIQIEVAREQGGYYEQLVRSLRSRADQFFVGEIREPATATEVLQVSGNGWPIIATMHAESVEQSFSKLQGLCQGIGSVDSVNAMIAAAIAAVVHLKLITVRDKTGHVRRLIATTLVLDGREDTTGIRAKIRKGDFATLNTEIEAQKNADTWNT